MNDQQDVALARRDAHTEPAKDPRTRALVVVLDGYARPAGGFEEMLIERPKDRRHRVHYPRPESPSPVCPVRAVGERKSCPRQVHVMNAQLGVERIDRRWLVVQRTRVEGATYTFA